MKIVNLKKKSVQFKDHGRKSDIHPKMRFVFGCTRRVAQDCQRYFKYQNVKMALNFFQKACGRPWGEASAVIEYRLLIGNHQHSLLTGCR